MALTWDWKSKCGEAIVKSGDREFTIDLYNGNAYLIFIHEFEEDGVEKYELYSFWADKTHAKRCLGLEKDTYNLYAEGHSVVTKFRINKAKCRKAAEIIGLIAKAFDEIDIEIYSDKETE